MEVFGHTVGIDSETRSGLLPLKRTSRPPIHLQNQFDRWALLGCANRERQQNEDRKEMVELYSHSEILIILHSKSPVLNTNGLGS
jgi:hypothetical protein